MNGERLLWACIGALAMTAFVHFAPVLPCEPQVVNYPTPWGAVTTELTPDGTGRCRGVWWKNVVTFNVAHTDNCQPPNGPGINGDIVFRAGRAFIEGVIP